MEGKSQAPLLNVLQNELVMEHLSGYLSTVDLGQCRRVSKTWNEWLTPVFRRNAVVTRIGKFLEWKLENPNSENFERHPFKKFHIDLNHCFDDDVNPFGARFPMKLLATCAPVMTYLKISGACPPEFSKHIDFEADDEIPQDLDFPRLRTFILDGEDISDTCKFTIWIIRKLIIDGTGAPRTTHVTTLEIISSSFSVGLTGRSDEVGELIYQLFIQSTGLEVFRVRNFGKRPRGESSYSELESHLKVLSEIRKGDARKFQIKVLDVLMMNLKPEAQVPLRFAVALRDVNFPLETMVLDLGTQTEDSALFELLDPFKGTLKKLVLYCGTVRTDPVRFYNEFPFAMEFPSLRFFHYVGVSFLNLNYLQFMPKLTQLAICSGYDKERFYAGSSLPKRWDADVFTYDMLSANEELIGRMEELLDFRLDFTCPSAAVEMLARLMPNLQRLNIAVLHADENLNLELLQKIEENFGSLSHLTLQMKMNSGNTRVRNFRKLKNLENIVLSPVVEIMDSDIDMWIGNDSSDEQDSEDEQDEDENDSEDEQNDEERNDSEDEVDND